MLKQLLSLGAALGLSCVKGNSGAVSYTLYINDDSGLDGGFCNATAPCKSLSYAVDYINSVYSFGSATNATVFINSDDEEGTMQVWNETIYMRSYDDYLQSNYRLVGESKTSSVIIWDDYLMTTTAIESTGEDNSDINIYFSDLTILGSSYDYGYIYFWQNEYVVGNQTLTFSNVDFIDLYRLYPFEKSTSNYGWSYGHSTINFENVGFYDAYFGGVMLDRSGAGGMNFENVYFSNAYFGDDMCDHVYGWDPSIWSNVTFEGSTSEYTMVSEQGRIREGYFVMDDINIIDHHAEDQFLRQYNYDEDAPYDYVINDVDIIDSYFDISVFSFYSLIGDVSFTDIKVLNCETGNILDVDGYFGYTFNVTNGGEDLEFVQKYFGRDAIVRDIEIINSEIRDDIISIQLMKNVIIDNISISTTYGWNLTNSVFYGLIQIDDTYALSEISISNVLIKDSVAEDSVIAVLQGAKVIDITDITLDNVHLEQDFYFVLALFYSDEWHINMTNIYINSHYLDSAFDEMTFVYTEIRLPSVTYGVRFEPANVLYLALGYSDSANPFIGRGGGPRDEPSRRQGLGYEYSRYFYSYNCEDYGGENSFSYTYNYGCIAPYQCEDVETYFYNWTLIDIPLHEPVIVIETRNVFCNITFDLITIDTMSSLTGNTWYSPNYYNNPPPMSIFYGCDAAVNNKTVQVFNCDIKNNYNWTIVGCDYMSFCRFEFYNCIFDNNILEWQGDILYNAIYLDSYSQGSITIYDSLFVGDYANQTGGVNASWLYHEELNSTFECIRCEFVDTRPTLAPTAMPTDPSFAPTSVPSSRPSNIPTSVPSNIPTMVPTSRPTSIELRDLEVQITMWGDFDTNLDVQYVETTIEDACTLILDENEVDFRTLNVTVQTIESFEIVSLLAVQDVELTDLELVTLIDLNLESSILEVDTSGALSTLTSVAAVTEIEEVDTGKKKNKGISEALEIILIVIGILVAFCVICGLLDYFCVNKVSPNSKYKLNSAYHDTPGATNGTPGATTTGGATEMGTVGDTRIPGEAALERVDSASNGVLMSQSGFSSRAQSIGASSEADLGGPLPEQPRINVMVDAAVITSGGPGLNQPHVRPNNELLEEIASEPALPDELDGPGAENVTGAADVASDGPDVGVGVGGGAVVSAGAGGVLGDGDGPAGAVTGAGVGTVSGAAPMETNANVAGGEA